MKKLGNILLLLLTTVLIILGAYYGLVAKDKASHDVNLDGSVIHIYTLDIGQGDAHLIQVGDEFSLIDSGDVEHRERIIALLQERKVNKLKRVILTHPHSDHIGGMYAILNTFPIEMIYDNGYAYPSSVYKTYMKDISAKNIPRKVVKDGDTIDFGSEIKFLVVGPGDKPHLLANGKSDANNDSIVGKLVYRDFSMLFTGDAEIIEEKEMLAAHRNDLQSTILKIGHHGSNGSTTQAFLNAVKPKAAVISVGLHNKYEHPHRAVLNRLGKANIPIYRTDEDGTIHITTDGHSWEIHKER